jgi:hypothetical protein
VLPYRGARRSGRRAGGLEIQMYRERAYSKALLDTLLLAGEHGGGGLRA